MSKLKSKLMLSIGMPMAVALATPFASPAHADTVTDWNAIMQATVSTAPSNPFFQARWGAIVQLAVFEAVNAIEGDYEPYLAGVIIAPPGASPDAAAIAAAYRTLVTLRPGSAAALDAARAASLAAIPDGPAKDAGIAAGEDAAAAMLLLRANDGWNAVVPYTPGTAPGDWQPTPHGKQLALAAVGKLPFYVKGWTGEAVGVEDAAAALLLAAEKGRNGERYIISERFISVRELYETAAEAAGVPAPRFGVPLPVMYAMGYAGDLVRTVTRRDFQLTSRSVRLMHIWPRLDHGKAERELGWQPTPVHESVRRATKFFREHRRGNR